ncbi:MAG: hypothetical protein JXB85_03545 [Anaerolineales bacterium]|nr:hypothetical protein [Anaerolineales bacterium]
MKVSTLSTERKTHPAGFFVLCLTCGLKALSSVSPDWPAKNTSLRKRERFFRKDADDNPFQIDKLVLPCHKRRFLKTDLPFLADWEVLR